MLNKVRELDPILELYDEIVVYKRTWKYIISETTKVVLLTGVKLLFHTQKLLQPHPEKSKKKIISVNTALIGDNMKTTGTSTLLFF